MQWRYGHLIRRLTIGTVTGELRAIEAGIQATCKNMSCCSSQTSPSGVCLATSWVECEVRAYESTTIKVYWHQWQMTPTGGLLFPSEGRSDFEARIAVLNSSAFYDSSTVFLCNALSKGAWAIFRVLGSILTAIYVPRFLPCCEALLLFRKSKFHSNLRQNGPVCYVRCYTGRLQTRESLTAWNIGNYYCEPLMGHMSFKFQQNEHTSWKADMKSAPVHSVHWRSIFSMCAFKYFNHDRWRLRRAIGLTRVQGLTHQFSRAGVKCSLAGARRVRQAGFAASAKRRCPRAARHGRESLKQRCKLQHACTTLQHG